MTNLNHLKISRLNIQLTKKCNQRCQSCNSYEIKELADELSVSEIETSINAICKKFPINNIAFTGGEPTLYTNILEIARIAKRYSPNVSITTNGYYCTTRERVAELLESGINRFSFSYHGIGTQDQFSGCIGSEARIRKAINWLIDEREKGKNIYIKIGSLFGGGGIRELEKMLDYAEEHKIDLYIEILDTTMPIFTKSKMAENNSTVDPDILKDSLETIRKWKDNGRRVLIDDKGIEFIRHWYAKDKITGCCPLGNTELFIESNGNIRTGCWVLPAIGNIRVTPIENILKSEKYKENVTKMQQRACPGCTCGYLMQSKYMD